MPRYEFVVLLMMTSFLLVKTLRIAVMYQGVNLEGLEAYTATRESINKITGETRYFISSLSANNPAKLEHAVRAYWAIENNLDWVLDIAFDEDRNRTRKGHSAANLATIRHCFKPDK
ncbi:MAG: ISAs1 family transposase [Nitrosomonas sp.]|nr:ISAs1 family transposase [Nitrosomonas sp.]